MQASPLAQVKKNFGTRGDLVKRLSEMVDKQNGDTTAEQVAARLGGLSNAQLLRLYKVEQTVRERFGDRDKLIEHIISSRKKAGLTADDVYRTKLNGFSKARLLDLTKRKN